MDLQKPTVTPEQAEVFHASLSRCMATEEFLDSFYDRFLASSPAIKAKFEKTNFVRQKRALVASFYMMMMAGEVGFEDDGHLAKIADKHGPDRIDVPAAWYDIWLDCLIHTVEKVDPSFSTSVRESWLAIMRPGIEYMKQRRLQMEKKG